MVQILTDVVMPEEVLRAGVRGKNMRRNTRTQNQGGFVNANILWANTLRQYEVGFVPMDLSLWHTLEGLHEVTDAGAYGFLMLDPKDHTATGTEGKLQGYLNGALVGAPGYGYGGPTHQLFKSYSSVGTTRTRLRRIRRPVSPATMKVNGTVNSVGVSPGDIDSIDYDTGDIAFVPLASTAVVAWVAGATTRVTLTDVSLVDTGQYVYFTGVSGTIAPVVNEKVFQVATKAGSEIVLAVNTTGLTATVNGTAEKHWQPTDAMSWEGSFYTPVHFANDDLDWDLVVSGDYESRVVAGPNVILQEVRE